MKPQQAAGILFRKNNRWLLIERKNRPFGFGIPAGHSEKWESPEETAMREAGEEIRSRSQGKLKLKKALLKKVVAVVYNPDYQQTGISPWDLSGKHIHKVHVFSYDGVIPSDLVGLSDARNPRFYSSTQITRMRRRLTPAVCVALQKLGVIPRTSAVIFDHDGTLVEMFEAHLMAFQKVFDKIGLEFSQKDLSPRYGQKSYDIIKLMLKKRGWKLTETEIWRLTHEKQRLYRSFAAKKIKLLPGVSRLLLRLKSKGYYLAIASSGARKSIELTLKATGLTGVFSEIVTGEDVKHGKPHPDLFLEAARRLGQRPEDCVVIEDSIHGIQAAKKAGMKSVAVATGPTHLSNLINAKPDLAIPNLTRTSQILSWLE